MAAPQSSSKSNPSLFGTMWRTLRVLVLGLFIAAVCYALISVGIAFTTADKCGHSFQGQKNWVYWPPGWECSSTP